MPTVVAHVPVDRVHRPSPQKPPPAPISTKNPIAGRHVSPALYATPETTLLIPISPSSPSSFPPPSPYLINHKRRGPRLLKSQSLGPNGTGGAQSSDKSLTRTLSEPTSPVSEKKNNEFHREKDEMERVDGFHCGKDEMEGEVNRFDGKKGKEKAETSVEREDFVDLQEPMGIASEEGNGIEKSWKPSTPIGEFYDAFEEISSDGGSAFKQDQTNTNTNNADEELRETRLSLVMEKEKRKQAEVATEVLKNEWLRLRQHLALIGFDLRVPPMGSNNLNFEFDSAEELCQQIVATRFVSDAICTEISRAEVAHEMDHVIQAKNFEISRLTDRVHFYEAANKEMSLRNQEAIELGRQERIKRKKRQKWFWASTGLVVTLGSVAITWSYLPASGSVQIEHKDVSTNPK